MASAPGLHHQEDTEGIGYSLSLGQVLLVIALLLVSWFIPGGSTLLREFWTFPKDTPVDYGAD